MKSKEDLSVLIDNVLHIWGLIDPKRIYDKPKIHLLTHLVDDIRRFGPAILFSTEIFECFNAVFRTCSVLSNHQAPSRDIALTFIGLERFKHQLSGGWWKTADGTWLKAGEGILKYFDDARIRARIGWTVNSKEKHGTV